MNSSRIADWSQLPLSLIEEHNLVERIHDRGGEKEVRFYWQANPTFLPRLVGRQAPNHQVGEQGPGREEIAHDGWTWQEKIEDGWRSSLAPEPVTIPASFGLMNGV